jgi:hypothetical protein
MRTLCLGFLVLLVACSLFEDKDKPKATACANPEWELVWFDEFDYSGLPNPQKWDYDVGGHGWGNQEAQYYTRAA